MMRTLDAIARGISALFNPLIIPTLAIFILFQLNTYVSFSVTVEARRFIMAMVFVNTGLAPIVAILVLKRLGYITDLFLYDSRERIFPLLFSAVMFFMTYYLLRQLTLPSPIYFYLMGASLLALLTLLISFLWKISIHMVSLGGLTGMLIVTSILLNVDVSRLIIAAFLVSGVTGAARIHLRAHSPSQVYAGYLLGLLVLLLLFIYLLG
ncbi:MAG: hypothetical protein ACLFS0_01525 [Bacteroidales bacterium]